MRISAAMIVKNEEVMLPDCLESIKGLDEIVIVDTGSKDRTVEIAGNYGTVYHFEWCDDFAAARNFATSKCTGDWIFVIDADERLKSSVKDLRKAVKSAKDKKFIMVNVALCPGNSWDNPEYYQSSIRLFRRIPEIKYDRAIHNTLTLLGSQVEPRKVSYVSQITMVSGFSPAHMDDPERTFRMLKRQLELNPDSTRDLYYLAVEYLYKKQDGDEALKLLQRYFALTFYQPWTNELADACYLMATIYVNRKDWHKAMSSAITAVMMWHTFKAPYVMLSQLCEIAGMVEPAKYWRALSEKVNNEGVLFVR